ncbi:MAG: hypothetical protein IPG39_15020 [Bacteroidetes bacterium]|nr:hypothetical protein [Bacteroidota bacterium]
MKKSVWILLLVLPQPFRDAKMMIPTKHHRDSSTVTFPVNVGHEQIYDAVLITKDDFFRCRGYHLLPDQEVVESVFNDNQGRPTQRLERYPD